MAKQPILMKVWPSFRGFSFGGNGRDPAGGRRGDARNDAWRPHDLYRGRLPRRFLKKRKNHHENPPHPLVLDARLLVAKRREVKVTKFFSGSVTRGEARNIRSWTTTK